MLTFLSLAIVGDIWVKVILSSHSSNISTSPGRLTHLRRDGCSYSGGSFSNRRSLEKRVQRYRRRFCASKKLWRSIMSGSNLDTTTGIDRTLQV